MSNKEQVLAAIKKLCDVDAQPESAVSDFLDSLTLVELALEISDTVGSNTLFERHEFFVAKTVQDLIDVTDKDLRGEE